MAHGKADEITARHLPIWKSTNFDLWIVSPNDDESKFANATIGESAHSGSKASARLFETFLRAFKLGYYDRYIFGEYDTLIFKGIPYKLKVDYLYAPLFTNGDPSFSSLVYPHPIWVLNQLTLAKLLIFGHPNFEEEQGFCDRWLARWCDLGGIKMFNDDKTYSRNSIDTPVFQSEAEACLRNGGWAIHGCKTKECLEGLLKQL